MSKKIFVLILKNRITNETIFKKYYETNINPINNGLKCLKNLEIEEVRSFEDIQFDNYHYIDDEIYKIRFDEIKSVYTIDYIELSEYLSTHIASIDDDSIDESLIKMELDELDLENLNIGEYEEFIISTNRHNKINNILKGKKRA